jgi:phosphohistidine phosphatase
LKQGENVNNAGRLLIVMRHAKSSWENANATDHQRRLNEQGREAAPKMARWLAEHDWLPDSIVSSNAQRTMETTELLLTTWGKAIDVAYTQKLYLAPAEAYLTEASRFADSVHCGMLIGHNPGVSILAGKVAEEIDHMPTCSAAIFRLTVEQWSELARLGVGGLRLVAFQAPKKLPTNQ